MTFPFTIAFLDKASGFIEGGELLRVYASYSELVD